jgi:hypothetical protein
VQGRQYDCRTEARDSNKRSAEEDPQVRRSRGSLSQPRQQDKSRSKDERQGHREHPSFGAVSNADGKPAHHGRSGSEGNGLSNVALCFVGLAHPALSLCAGWEQHGEARQACVPACGRFRSSSKAGVRSSASGQRRRRNQNRRAGGVY